MTNRQQRATTPLEKLIEEETDTLVALLEQRPGVKVYVGVVVIDEETGIGVQKFQGSNGCQRDTVHQFARQLAEKAAQLTVAGQ